MSRLNSFFCDCKISAEFLWFSYNNRNIIACFQLTRKSGHWYQDIDLSAFSRVLQSKFRIKSRYVKSGPRFQFLLTLVFFQSGANPEAENDKKETPLEVAEDAETRRLLLEGIPIFREYEKTRKKTLQSLQAAKAGNFADCLTTEGDEKPATTR